ncbi:MAG: divalent-cation tolerance protein CutA [Nitrososphaerota archaeon]
MMTLLLVTYPSDKDYMGWSRSLVERGLAASVNVINIKSTYFWESQVQTGDEVLLIIKSDRRVSQNLKDVVLAEHPYKVPCIVELSPIDVNSSYLEWVAAVTLGRRLDGL